MSGRWTFSAARATGVRSPGCHLGGQRCQAGVVCLVPHRYCLSAAPDLHRRLTSTSPLVRAPVLDASAAVRARVPARARAGSAGELVEEVRDQGGGAGVAYEVVDVVDAEQQPPLRAGVVRALGAAGFGVRTRLDAGVEPAVQPALENAVRLAAAAFELLGTALVRAGAPLGPGKTAGPQSVLDVRQRVPADQVGRQVAAEGDQLVADRRVPQRRVPARSPRSTSLRSNRLACAGASEQRAATWERVTRPYASTYCRTICSCCSGSKPRTRTYPAGVSKTRYTAADRCHVLPLRSPRASTQPRSKPPRS